MCMKQVADILAVGHAVPQLAESPIRRKSCETDGVAFYYEGDLSDSDCGSVRDREIDTWEDRCDSAFCNGYGGFPLDTEDTQPAVVFSDQLFWDEDIAKPSRMLPDCGNVPVSPFQAFDDTVIPLVAPDTGRIVRFNNNDSELMDSRIGEFSVLSLGVCDPSIDMDTLDGDEQGICSRDVDISDGDEEWPCLLYSTSSGSMWDKSVTA